MYVYKSERDDIRGKVYAVGYWAPVSLDGETVPTFRVASRHATPQEARRRVNYLNGGSVPSNNNAGSFE